MQKTKSGDVVQVGYEDKVVVMSNDDFAKFQQLAIDNNIDFGTIDDDYLQGRYVHDIDWYSSNC